MKEDVACVTLPRRIFFHWLDMLHSWIGDIQRPFFLLMFWQGFVQFEKKFHMAHFSVCMAVLITQIENISLYTEEWIKLQNNPNSAMHHLKWYLLLTKAQSLLRFDECTHCSSNYTPDRTCRPDRHHHTTSISACPNGYLHTWDWYLMILLK